MIGSNLIQGQPFKAFHVSKTSLLYDIALISWVHFRVGDAGHVFSLEYPHIAMHAVSRDVSVFPNAECLYLVRHLVL